jgi:hypothetical protein
LGGVGKLQMNSSRSMHLSQDNELIPKRWEAKGDGVERKKNVRTKETVPFKSPNKTTELL